MVASGLEKRFGRAAALRGVDLEVHAGQTVAVLGPNGAGKSTLLRLVAGLARPTAGAVTVLGERAGRPAARGRVGLVSHSTFLYPDLTARENLIFAARLYGVRNPAERARTLLEEYNLDSVADRRTGSFSRGTAQRLAIARAIVHDPDVLLLDEPFTGLDVAASRRLAGRLVALRGTERAVLLVTHDVVRAVELADLAVVLLAGRIAARLEGAALSTASLEEAYTSASDAEQ